MVWDRADAEPDRISAGLALAASMPPQGIRDSTNAAVRVALD